MLTTRKLVGITRAELKIVLGAAVSAKPWQDAVLAIALAAQRAVVKELGLTACDEGCNHLVSHCYSKAELADLCAALGLTPKGG